MRVHAARRRVVQRGVADFSRALIAAPIAVPPAGRHAARRGSSSLAARALPAAAVEQPPPSSRRRVWARRLSVLGADGARRASRPARAARILRPACDLRALLVPLTVVPPSAPTRPAGAAATTASDEPAVAELAADEPAGSAGGSAGESAGESAGGGAGPGACWVSGARLPCPWRSGQQPARALVELAV